MKIKITEFGERHFNKNFSGTKILDMSKEDFEEAINSSIIHESINISKTIKIGVDTHLIPNVKVLHGYAPFCKLVIIENFTNTRVGSMPITLENYSFIRSGYSARRDSELPVFSRWLELPLEKPKAKWLVLVLYSKEQLDKEAALDINATSITPDCDWGIVAILGQSHSNEEPMKPETMLRNALGIEEGGSGTPLNRGNYLKSVNFWSKNITVK